MNNIPDPQDEHEPVAGSTGTMPAAVPDSADDGPMTERQAAILRDLCDRHGEHFDESLTEHQARERIDWLKSRD